MVTHWTQEDVLVNGVRLHYTRTGHGDKRPMVLIHGFSDNGLCWTPVARALEADYDVIMPDMRGHGLSARVQPGDDVDMAADVAELIRTLGLHRPIVGGHSMGAGVTYQLVVRFPELVSALFLEDPAWRLSWPEPTPEQLAENPMRKWVQSLGTQTLEELLVQYRKDHPTWPEELLLPMCESKKQLDPTILDVVSTRIRSDRQDWQKTLPNVTQPMLLFTGNPEMGAIVTPDAVEKVRELNPNVTIVNIPDVGHLIRFDKYPIFMEALWAFLKQLPA
ncbi:MAG TPA: alpha/beta hydrolase [Anaerolineae bacterium]|nr:alpha/beta hydrolase [Anaerolineae bacterium]HQK13567.1 alpha/beta hydrolase [Anaerolineae bacterium]